MHYTMALNCDTGTKIPMYLNRAYPTLSILLYIAFSACPFSIANDSQQGLKIEELETLSQPDGPTLFTEMAQQTTGIVMENEYLDPRMWNERYQEFALGAIGTGISVGDYDNDARPDVFIVNKTGTSRLFKNLGGWKFKDVTDESGLGKAEGGLLDSVSSWFSSDDEEESVEFWKQGAAFADLNNDGWLDLYLCRFEAPNLLYMNNGDGTFTKTENAGGLGLVSASGMVSFCDFDRDGWLDAFLQTNMLDSRTSPEGNRDRLYHNNGDGTFTDITDQAGIDGKTLGHSATWWDYDEDGWPDLYVANDFATPDQLFRNNGGKGSKVFTEVIDAVVPHQPFSSMGADIGDVNNDGRIDLFVSEMAPTTHEMDQRGMAITRYTMKKEVLDPESTPQYMFNALYLNTGIGRMLEGAWMYGLARTDWTWSTRFEDLDNDGFIDLHVTNGMSREYQNDDLRQRILRAARPTARMSIMKSNPVMNEANLAFRNLGGTGFERVEKEWGLGQIGVSFGTAFGDFDGDGDQDLIYSNYEAAPTVLRNDSQNGNRAIFSLRGTTSNYYGVGATIRIETDSGEQVRQLVLARGYLSSSEPVLHFGLGASETIKTATIEWPSGTSQTFTDLPVNKRFTITESENQADLSDSNPTNIQRFQEYGEAAGIAKSDQPFKPTRTSPQALMPFEFSRRGPTLALEDIDGDGLSDIVQGAFGGESISLLFGKEDGTFEPAKTSLRSESPTDGPIVVEDFDGDGDKDLFITEADPTSKTAPNQNPRLFLNNGDGSFEEANEQAIPQVTTHAGAASAGDFNQDGSIDLFIGSRSLPGSYPLSGSSALLANRGGSFVNVAAEQLPDSGKIGMITGSLWTDFDSDGRQDLIVSTEWGHVKYFRNMRGQGFVDASKEVGFTAAGSGLWSCIVQGDFNGDGQLDFAVGNLGLNTRYHAASNAPAVLFFGAFGGRGPGQLIEAKYDAGRLVPWRSRKELIAAIPPLERRFPSTNVYASSTLEEILGPQALAEAKRFEATELRSGALISRENGTYEFVPFPQIAQIAPIQGIAVGDFNRDGHLDLAATQNLHDVEASIGRFDGGLGQLLLGDGAGNFHAVEPAESGLVIPADGKAISTGDFNQDGWLDIVATRAGSRTLLFKNRPSEETD